jgi:ATP synthase protein I
VAPESSEGGDFDERLARAKKKRGGGGSDGPEQPSLLGFAFRIGTELIAGVAVGGLIGWALDRWLGTSPLLLILFFVIGTGAGFMNVFRGARAMNAEQAKGPPAPGVPDDDDD